MKSPAFQFYAENFLNGTAEMTPEEVGIYIRLLCHQWHRGGLPDNDKKLSQLSGGQKEALDEVKKKFILAEDGLLKNERMEQARADQLLYHQKQKEKALKRWNQPAATGAAQTDAESVPGHKNGISQTDALQSSPSSATTSSTLINVEIENTNPVADSNSGNEKIKQPGQTTNSKSKAEIILPWPDEDFAAEWQKWKDYRAQEFQKKFKRIENELAQLKHLHNLSCGTKQTAIAIINQSIGNQWQGLFALKNQNQNNHANHNKPKTPFWRIAAENIE